MATDRPSRSPPWYNVEVPGTPDQADARLRAQMFDHLDRLLAASPNGSLSSKAIKTFIFDGRNLRLIVQPGIWKPAGLEGRL
jgi:putative restriction endonuclease